MSTEEGRRVVERTLRESIESATRMLGADLSPAVWAAETIIASLVGGGKVLVFGNGGSAAEAQHFAAELVGRFTRERRGLAAIALTTDTSTLTAVANDMAFSRVFARQIEALGRTGDVALGISTSGRSPNVLEGLETARAHGLRTIGLTGGDGGPVADAAEITVTVPDRVTARIQEVHLMLLHAICEIVESRLAGAAPDLPAREPREPGTA